MEHFSEQVWADYVRGIHQPKEARELEMHLAIGCPDCTRLLGMYQQVYSIATNEPGLTPPDTAVRMAKVVFATSRPPHSSLWTMAKVVFDSVSQPLTAGVRSGASGCRHLVFETETVIVDLVLDVRPQSEVISLVGQVVDKHGAKIAPRRVGVILWTDNGQPLAEASANEFGEFQMEFAVQDRLRLSVEIVGQQPIRIPPTKLNPDVIGPVT